MTKEEHQAYWAKREQELFEMCQIKTEEQKGKDKCQI